MLKVGAGAKHLCTYILVGQNEAALINLLKCYFLSYTFIKIYQQICTASLSCFTKIFSHFFCSFSSDTLSLIFLLYAYYCENEITYNVLWDSLSKQTAIKLLSVLFQLPLLVLCFTLLVMFLNNE